ncbi:uncharacterized protein LTR77_005390 [Saxophila tyrrhenica]|uniref:Uncharacterized protein n=1 Tax=Saxophila tyrrhenica TaxID=1690608 RepID=A0AAV9PBD0_9PEZI|nr:hypothetical protein LTR77_005390 [Saxophila tyrrhenica]
MPGNVVRAFRTPRALGPQWRSLSLRSITGHSDDNGSTGKDLLTFDDDRTPLSREELDRKLRAADQTELLEIFSVARDRRSTVQKVKEHASAMPLTVQLLPEVPAYKVGYSKTMLIDPLQTKLDEAVEYNNVLLQHLTDLQFEPYKKSRDNAVVEFGEEMKKKSRDEQLEMREQVKRDAQAKVSRMNANVEKLLGDVTEAVESHGGTVRKAANPFDVKPEVSDEVEDVDVEDDRTELSAELDDGEAPVIKTEAQNKGAEQKKQPAAPSLLSRFQRLRASISAGDKSK